MIKNDLRIEILGTIINISAEEEPEYLKKILDKYRKKIEDIQNISGIKDPLTIAVLTGFILSEELEKAGQYAMDHYSEDTVEAERLALGIITRLEECIPDELPQKHEDTADIVKLQNTIKHYDWGSPEWIPSLMGQKNPERIPWAELWMGINNAGPSRSHGTKPELLSEMIIKNREAMLGKACAAKFGNLPFLFKLIAVAKPLSIQAHPSAAQAREGFDRENTEGLPFDEPARNYRDPMHKPELICALSPFAALCGFREKEEIYSLIQKVSQISDGILKEGLEKLCSALMQENGETDENPYKTFLEALFDMDTTGLGTFLMKRETLLERDFPEYSGEWKICSYLANLFPSSSKVSADAAGFTHSCDPGILAPLFMNIIELKPGEAMYIPAGIIHSYIHGLGIELMADSDNVIRAGLTKKHIDRDELFKTLNFSEYRPEIIKAPLCGSLTDSPSSFCYPDQYEEFSLSVLKSYGHAIHFSRTNPSIILVSDGTVSVVVSENSAEDPEGSSPEQKPQEMVLKAGESIFVPAGKKLVLSGYFYAHAASSAITGEAEDSDVDGETKVTGENKVTGEAGC